MSSSLANKGLFVPANMPGYHPREPSDSPLWKILHNHCEDFKAGYGEHCEKRYGFFRPVVDEVVEEYLSCGRYQQHSLEKGTRPTSGRMTSAGLRQDPLMRRSWMFPTASPAAFRQKPGES